MKILYYYSKLNIGGAERSTVRLLNKLSERGHDVTILLRWSGGVLEGDLMPSVKRVHLKKDHGFRSSFMRALEFLFEYVALGARVRALSGEKYDICISGLFGYDPGILFHHIKAKQYYQMLRNDVGKTLSYGDTKRYLKEYGERFDAYIGVSEYTTQSFREACPELADRAHTIYNVLADVPEVKEPDPFDQYPNKLKILTVCRLSDQAKGLYRMVNVCKELKRQFGETFVWFIVGDGPDYAELEKRISAADLEKQMILCGEQENPFPYYKYADFVAVLSYYEGLCGVVNEAKQMEKPVIATEFSGIHEQIVDGVNGVIVENCEEAILTGMKELLAHPEKLTEFQNNGLPEELRGNDLKIQRFETLYHEIEREKTDVKGQRDHSRT